MIAPIQRIPQQLPRLKKCQKCGYAYYGEACNACKTPGIRSESPRLRAAALVREVPDRQLYSIS
jgi:hypothetical protein